MGEHDNGRKILTVAWQMQSSRPDSVSSKFMDMTVTYFPNTEKVALFDSNAATLVNHNLSAEIFKMKNQFSDSHDVTDVSRETYYNNSYSEDIESVDVSTPVNRGLSVSGEMINSPDCHKMVDAFLENHGNGFRSEDINAVREVVTDIFQLESPDRIGQMMDKVRELQRYKNDETSLSVKIEVSDETTSVALFINDSPFKCTIWHGKNASNHLKGINLSGINLKGSILRNVDLTRATLIGANLSVVTGKSSSQGFSV